MTSPATPNSPKAPSDTTPPNLDDLVCARCETPLQMGKVLASYMAQTFPVDLPLCPTCGFVYVSEDLAGGRMLKVEQALEDK